MPDNPSRSMKIYLPTPLRLRMDDYTQLQWSRIAQDAFTRAMNAHDTMLETLIEVPTTTGAMQLHHDGKSVVLKTPDGETIHIRARDASRIVRTITKGTVTK